MFALLNIIGLILNIYGVWIIYKATPKIDTMSYIAGNITTGEDTKANKQVRKGMLFIFVGFILQLPAAFSPVIEIISKHIHCTI